MKRARWALPPRRDGRCRGRLAATHAACALLLLVAGCGGKAAKQPEAPVLAKANTVALGEMVQGVESAKQKSGQDEAIARLESAVAKDPGLWEAHYNLGVLLARKGSLSEAEPHLAKAAELSPNSEDVALALGEVRRRRGELDLAADGLAAFVKAYPDAVDARFALVAALREAGRVDEAISNAREVLKRRPNDSEAFAALALSHLERGESDTAELLSSESLKAEHKTAVAERTAGLVALKRGDDAVAFQHFARASELDPKDTVARLNKGVVLLQAGVYPRAEKELRADLDVENDNDEAALGLAAALRGQGKRDSPGPYLEAEKVLKGVLDRDPHELDALFDLAVLYADFLGKPDKARPFVEQFLSEAPDKHPARAAAEKLKADLGATKPEGTESPGGAPPPATSKGKAPSAKPKRK